MSFKILDKVRISTLFDVRDGTTAKIISVDDKSALVEFDSDGRRSTYHFFDLIKISMYGNDNPKTIITFKDAILAEHEAKKPKYFGRSSELHKEGKCPTCGVTGYVHLSTFICPDHGPY